MPNQSKITKVRSIRASEEFWNITCEIAKNEYISFLEFLSYTQFCIIKKGELNAKSEQDNKGTEHKGE